MTYLQISNNIYDLTKWKSLHPGGKEIIELFHNLDATDAFYSIHSEAAISKLKYFPITKDSTDDKLTLYQEFKKDITCKGLDKKSLFWELFYPTLIIIQLLFAYFYKESYLASIVLGIALSQCGWIGHDYMHQKRRVCSWLSQVVMGYCTNWWRHKHNVLHHNFVNYVGVDMDIGTDPILYFVKNRGQTWNRRFQHIYYLIIFSLLHISWRIQSIMSVIREPTFARVMAQIFNLYLLSYFGIFNVIVGSMITGFIMGFVVTLNHSAETVHYDNNNYSFLIRTLQSTTNVIGLSPILSYLFGGMQYQVEHHLFPTFPRYNYSKIRFHFKKFCKLHNLPYKEDTLYNLAGKLYQHFKQCSISIDSIS